MYCTNKCYVACLHGDHVYNEAYLCIVLSSGHVALITSQVHIIIPEVIMGDHTE